LEFVYGIALEGQEAISSTIYMNISVTH